jgi:hypothetical protein
MHVVNIFENSRSESDVARCNLRICSIDFFTVSTLRA